MQQMRQRKEALLQQDKKELLQQMRLVMQYLQSSPSLVDSNQNTVPYMRPKGESDEIQIPSSDGKTFPLEGSSSSKHVGNQIFSIYMKEHEEKIRKYALCIGTHKKALKSLNDQKAKFEQALSRLQETYLFPHAKFAETLEHIDELKSVLNNDIMLSIEKHSKAREKSLEKFHKRKDEFNIFMDDIKSDLADLHSLEKYA